VNSGLSAYETIKRYSLLPQEFSAERQEITPTMKLRRRVIHEHHRDTVEGLFE
jgi:long-chain acyl-CoA synthetase